MSVSKSRAEQGRIRLVISTPPDDEDAATVARYFTTLWRWRTGPDGAGQFGVREDAPAAELDTLLAACRARGLSEDAMIAILNDDARVKVSEPRRES
jgi:hypothetical protein